MKQRIQNRIIARSVNAIVIMFVIQLFLLFDKTESGEPGELGEPSESGEPLIPCSLAKLHLSVSQSLASEEFLISGVSRLCDELCSQLCEINKASAHSAAQLKN